MDIIFFVSLALTMWAKPGRVFWFRRAHGQDSPNKAVPNMNIYATRHRQTMPLEQRLAFISNGIAKLWRMNVLLSI